MSAQVARRGLLCPKCGELAEPSDKFCQSGDYTFQPGEPVVGLDRDNFIVEVDGSPISPTRTLPTASNSIAIPPVAEVTPPAVNTPGPSAAPRSCSIEIMIDLSPRDGRPSVGEADYTEPPNFPTLEMPLNDPLVAFGRSPVMEPAIVLSGDQAVARLHGYLRHTTDGGYEVDNQSSHCGTFVRTIGVLLAEQGKAYRLKDGDQLEIGDWYTFTYHETPKQ